MIGPLTQRKGPAALAEVFLDVLSLDGDRAHLVDLVCAAALRHSSDEGPVGEFARTAVELDTIFPGDRGILAALLMNRVTLQPGQAHYVPAGHMHAHIRGTGIEVMANSDNVIRGGLTPKHIDVGELVRVVDFTPDDPIVTEPHFVRPGVERYRTPCAEFDVWRTTLDPGTGSDPAARAPVGPDRARGLRRTRPLVRLRTPPARAGQVGIHRRRGGLGQRRGGRGGVRDLVRIALAGLRCGAQPLAGVARGSRERSAILSAMSSPYPTAPRFNPPASWPSPPAGWLPEATWRPDPTWPPAPAGWPFYLDAQGRPVPPPSGAWTPAAYPTAGAPAGKRGKGCLIAALVAVGLLVAGGIGAFVVLRPLVDEAGQPQPVIAAGRIAEVYDPPLNNLENVGADDTPAAFFSEFAASDNQCEAQLGAAFLSGDRAQFVKEVGSTTEYDGVLVFYASPEAAGLAFQALDQMISECDPDKSPTASVGVAVRGGWHTYTGNLPFNEAETAVILQYGNAVTFSLTDESVDGAELFEAYVARLDSLQ